jgi:hypothetical protein
MARVVSLPFYYSCPAMKLNPLILLFTLLTAQCLAQSWTTPVNVSNMSSLNLTPSFTIDTNNIIHVVWVHKIEDNQHYLTIIMHSQSSDDGLTWDAPDTVLHIQDAWLLNTNVACDNHNHLVLTFDSISWGGTYTQVYAMEYNGVQWSAYHRISSLNNAKENKIIADHNGRVYCFWHEYYNGASKFMYRIYENGQWSDTYIPYADSGTYFLENIDVDTDNNLHGIGYFTAHRQSFDETVFAYFRYEYFNDRWSPIEIVNTGLPFRGCDIVADTLLLPQMVFSQFTGFYPYDYGMLYRKHGIAGWEPADTIVNHEEEYYPQIGINNQNEPEIVTVELITNENTLLYNYYKKNGEYQRELIDSDGSILFTSLLKKNNSLNLIYGKMPLNSVGNGNVYFTSKTNHVSANKPLKMEVEIFPNPGNGKFDMTISTKQNTSAIIKIYDILGKMVFHQSGYSLVPGTNSLKIDIRKSNSDLPSGIYRVVLQAGNELLQTSYILLP